MRKALVPMIASLALCGAATGALIATNASAAGTPKKPVMVAMVTAPGSVGMTAAPDGPPPGMMAAPGDMAGGPMSGPPDGKVGADMRARMTQMCKDGYARKVGEMAFLETKLQLTPTQAPLFARWKQVNLDIAQHHSGECDAKLAKFEARKPGDRPSVLDRMSREEDMLKTRLANLEAERPALEALYKSLTPEQQKSLGHEGMGPRPMMGGRMMGMMGHHGPMGPMGPMPPHGPADMPPPPPPQ